MQSEARTPATAPEAESTSLSRRTLVQGVAWSIPVVAATVAVPAAAASGKGTAVCAPCIKAGFPIVGGVISGAWTAQAVVVGHRATIVMPNVFGLDATSCEISFEHIIQPAFTFVVTKATLTMTDGRSYDSSLGLGAGVGNISTIGAFPAAFAFHDVELPDTQLFREYSTRPQRLTVFVQATFAYGLGAHIECPMTLVWEMHGLAAGAVKFGVGTINFSGSAAV